MKSIFRITFTLCTVIMCNQSSFSQVTNKSLEKSNKMEVATNTNKEVIHNLYENIMNNRKFELSSSVISEDYTNAQGEKGVEAFEQGIMAVINAFPDAKWTLMEIIAEGNKVFVKQQVQGTHTGVFQNISPTNKAISNDGMVIYKFENGKIISYQIQTDRFGFLQQLGILPSDPISLSQEKEFNVFFVDKFIIPKNAIEEFIKRMNYNREFIKTLSGFISDQVFEQKDNEGNLTIITIAVWENTGKLNEAKTAVQTEYRRIEFNPIEFNQRLNIKMERGEYTNLKE